MRTEATKAKVLSSLFWKLLERGGTSGIQFVVQIILARLLLPEEYGLIALVSIFITIAGIFVESGLNTALIQKKDTDELDLSTVFHTSLAVAAVLYVSLFFTAPGLAGFFNEPRLVDVIRVLSLTLFIGAVQSIQQAVIAINLEFRRLFYASLGGAVLSGAVGVGLAFAGYGIWALVGQQIANRLVSTGILLFQVEWRPSRSFSLLRLRKLFSFGWKLLVSSLLNTLTYNVRSLIIGKFYTPAMLGFFDRGSSFPGFLITNLNGSIQAVMLPAMASSQEDTERVRRMMRRSIVTSSFVVFPMMAGLAVISEPLIRVLLTDKWLPAVPFMQLACVSFSLWPIHTANLQAINALGRSDIFLKLEVVKMIIGLLVLAISIPFGIYAIAWGGVANGVISTFINASPNKNILEYGYLEQLKDIVPSLGLALVMAAMVSLIHLTGLAALLKVILGILAGSISYVALAAFLKMESYRYLKETIKEADLRKKRRK